MDEVVSNYERVLFDAWDVPPPILVSKHNIRSKRRHI
jgi:hypothetical protein